MPDQGGVTWSVPEYALGRRELGHQGPGLRAVRRAIHELTHHIAGGFVRGGSRHREDNDLPGAFFGLPGTQRVTGYTWVQIGLTSFTGGPSVQNRFYDGESLGAIIHLNGQNSIWVQETYNKIVTVPWYTTTSVGYTWSW